VVVSAVAQRAESGLPVGDGGRGVQQVAGGSRQPVKPRHHQHVTGLERIDHTAKLRPVGLGSAYMHVAEHLLASGLGSCRACASMLSLLPPGDTRA